MMGRVRWSHVTIALALIAAVAIAAPAIGGSSATTAGTVSKKTLKKLIKKEVSKQIVKAKGPAGPAGPPGPAGTNGTNGVDGTARAYAVVHGSFCALPPPTKFCALTRNEGVAYAAQVAQGTFCVGVNGISADDPATIAVVAPTVGGASTRALWLGASIGNRDCVGREFEVITGEADGPVNSGRDFTIVVL